MFKFKLRDISQNTVSLVTSIIAAVTAIICVVMTYNYSTATQDRQVRLEQISKFDGNSAQLIEAGREFISAVNNNGKDLNNARGKVRTVVASQLHDSENLRKFFDGRVDRLVTNYQTAISEMNDLSQKTSNVLEMPKWAESFGRVLDAKANLSTQLYSSAAKGSRAGSS